MSDDIVVQDKQRYGPMPSASEYAAAAAVETKDGQWVIRPSSEPEVPEKHHLLSAEGRDALWKRLVDYYAAECASAYRRAGVGPHGRVTNFSAALHAGGEMARTRLDSARVKDLEAEVETLKAKLEEITSRGVKYRGVWQAAEQYERGDLVTREGSMWACNRSSSRATPGTGSRDWTLAVKAGRDGRSP
jgi:hypothetical protein